MCFRQEHSEIIRSFCSSNLSSSSTHIFCSEQFGLVRAETGGELRGDTAVGEVEILNRDEGSLLRVLQTFTSN